MPLSSCGFDFSRTSLNSMIFTKRPHLDRKRCRACIALRPFERFIQIFGSNHGDAADVFLAFGEGAIGDQRHAAFHAHDGGGGRFVQTSCKDPAARRLELRSNRPRQDDPR